MFGLYDKVVIVQVLDYEAVLFVHHQKDLLHRWITL